MIKNRKSRNTGKKREEKKKVLISLEDTKSAKYYFRKLIQDKGLSGDVTFANHIGTDPGNVVEAIVKDSKKARYEKKWAVIDKDDYSRKQINGAIDRARALSICVAISNECYELWILLHFTPVTAHTSRADLRRQLNIQFRSHFNIDYSKASQDVYQLIIGMQDDALRNARNLVISCVRENDVIDPFANNPLTTVHQLVEYLNALRDGSAAILECFPENCR